MNIEERQNVERKSQGLLAVTSPAKDGSGFLARDVRAAKQAMESLDGDGKKV